ASTSAQFAFSVQKLPNGVLGQSYSETVNVVGGRAPFTLVATGVPAGLAAKAKGSSANRTGIPIKAGSITFTGAPIQIGNDFPITILATDSSDPQQRISITYFIDILPKENPGAEIVVDASQHGPAMSRDQLGANVNIGFTDNSSADYLPLWQGAGVGM